ncbi:MAG: PKD domain-containing protein [Bacteroidia bacterium]|nr:PKD domain-containing protein [Bacteroidia bacterium]
MKHTVRIFHNLAILLTIGSLLFACIDLQETDFIDLSADFVASQEIVQEGDTVRFFQRSSLVAQQFQWDFGDQNTSQDPNPLYTYAQFGQYNVRMRALKADGISLDSAVRRIVVLPRTTPAERTETFGDAQSEEIGFTLTKTLNPAGYLLVGRKNLNSGACHPNR